MKHRSLLIVATVGAVGLGALVWHQHEAGQRRAALITSVPALPEPLLQQSAAFAQRLSIATDLARREPGSGEPLAALAALYQANGYSAEAEVALHALASDDPREPRWPHRLAVLIGGFGRLDEAREWLGRVTALAPDYAPAWVRLGDTALKLNDPAGATVAYARALALNDPTVTPHADLGLARCETTGGDDQAAYARLTALVARSPDFGPAWSLLARLADQMNRPAEAGAARAKSVSRDRFRDVPDPWIDELLDACFDPYQLAVAADLHASASDRPRARRLLERALELDPENAAVHRQLGTLLADLGDLAAARGILEKSTRLAPAEADGWAYLVDVLKRQGDVPNLARAVDNGLAHNPRSPSLHLERGRLFAAAGDLPRAVDEIETSIKLRPAEPGPYVEVAGLYFKLNHIDEGIARLQAALKAEPGYPVALSTLAFVAIGQRDETVARHWLNAIEQQPKVPVADRAKLIDQFSATFGKRP